MCHRKEVAIKETSIATSGGQTVGRSLKYFKFFNKHDCSGTLCHDVELHRSTLFSRLLSSQFIFWSKYFFRILGNRKQKQAGTELCKSQCDGGRSRFHQISPFSSLNRVNWGCRGDSPNIFFIGFLIFLLLRSPWKMSKLQHKPFWGNSPFRLLSAQNRLFWGAWGGPQNFIFIGILIFL